MYISYIFLAFYNIKKLTFGEAYFCFIYKLLDVKGWVLYNIINLRTNII